MGFLLYSIHVVVAIFLILVVLLQQGKGADLSVFGGGSTMTAFGARGAATLLHKLTVIGFVLFMMTTLGIGVYEGNKGSASTVMTDEKVEAEEPAAESDVRPEAESFEDGALPESGQEAALPEEDGQGAALPDDGSPESAVPETDSAGAGDRGQDLPAGEEPSMSPSGEGGESQGEDGASRGG